MTYERQIFDTAPPIGGMRREFPCVSPISVSSGKITLECPVCGISFRRFLAWAKRVDVNFCGRACASAARVVRVEKECVVCGAAMSLTPSDAAKLTTCGKECSSIRKRSRGEGKRPGERNSRAYIEATKAVRKKASECHSCGAKHGPWVVRGVSATYSEETGVLVDARDAQLWCRACHLKDIAPLGHVARDAKKAAKSRPPTQRHLPKRRAG